jgi:hypothetical protein
MNFCASMRACFKSTAPSIFKRRLSPDRLWYCRQ